MLDQQDHLDVIEVSQLTAQLNYLFISEQLLVSIILQLICHPLIVVLPTQLTFNMFGSSRGDTTVSPVASHYHLPGARAHQRNHGTTGLHFVDNVMATALSLSQG